MASKSIELARECQRQSESCLYTSTSLFIWLRWLRAIKAAHIVLSILLGGLAGWSLLKESTDPTLLWIAGLSALLAGILPAVYAGLELDKGLDLCRTLASEFKNLQDRFRVAALVSAKKTYEEFETDVKPLLDRLEQARAHSYTAPEWCFTRAQKKIDAGHYKFQIDDGPESSEA